MQPESHAHAHAHSHTGKEETVAAEDIHSQRDVAGVLVTDMEGCLHLLDIHLRHVAGIRTGECGESCVLASPTMVWIGTTSGALLSLRRVVSDTPLLKLAALLSSRLPSAGNLEHASFRTGHLSSSMASRVIDGDLCALWFELPLPEQQTLASLCGTDIPTIAESIDSLGRTALM